MKDARERPLIYEFGEYRSNASEGILRRAAERINLTHKAVELLTILVERGGAVVGKEEMVETFWPVFDNLRDEPRFPDSLKRVGPAPD